MSDSAGDFTLGNVSLTGQSRVIRRFQNANKALHDRLLGIITREVEEVAKLARVRMGELFRNPGQMQDSISTNVQSDVNHIEGTVSASGLPYLAIQEFGGVTKPHPIFPVNAEALHFLFKGNAPLGPNQGRTAAFTASRAETGGEVFLRGVEHPGSHFPERSYLRYALAQRRAAINAAFAQAAADSLEDG